MVSNAKSKLLNSFDVDPLCYIRALRKNCKGGEFPKNVTPSRIQKAQKTGYHLRSTLLTAPEDYLEDGAYVISAISIVNAKGVAPTGIENREPWLRVARCCLYDGARFLSNGHGVAVETVKNGGFTWIFKDQTIFVKRPSSSSESLVLYIELNVSHRLAVDDKRALPKSERRCSRLVDEVTTCWATVQLTSLTPEEHINTLKVPLCIGNLDDPTSHEDLAKFHRRFLCGSVLPCLSLTFRSPPGQLPVALSWLPPLSICLSEMAVITCIYRSIISQEKEETSCAGPVCNPLGAYLPKIMDDEDIFVQFLRLWKFLIKQQAPQVESEYRDILEECTLLAAPLLNAQQVPQKRIANDITHRRIRQTEVEKCMWTIDKSHRQPSFDGNKCHRPKHWPNAQTIQCDRGYVLCRIKQHGKFCRKPN